MELHKRAPIVKQARAADTDPRAREELAVYKTYFGVLDAITTHLLDDADQKALTEVMRLLSESSSSDICALFLNKQGSALEPLTAQLQAVWQSRLMNGEASAFPRWNNIAYVDMPLVADTLQAGMVLSRALLELPYAEQGLFFTAECRSMHCIPLLISGDLAGFILLLSPRLKEEWLSAELNILCTVANDLALALMKKKAENQSIANQSRLQSLVGSTDDMLFEFDRAGIILNVWSTHPAMPNVDLRGMPLQKALPAAMSQAFMGYLNSAAHYATSKTVQFSLKLLKGEYYFTARLQTVPAEQGDDFNVVALVRDVTAIVQDEAQRRTMLDTFGLLEEAVVDLSVEGLLLHTTGAWANLRGIPVDAVDADMGKPIQQWVYPDELDKVLSALDRLSTGEASASTVRFRLKNEQGAVVWVEAKLIAHHAPHGGITGLRGVFRDITAAYLHESRITQLALYDSLTQLPNRILLDDHLQQAIARADRNQLKVALGFIDMDHFKQINDAFGHKAGDEVLISLSRRLKAALREGDTLARWGGDEFVVLLPDLPTLDPLRKTAERLREIARQGILIDGLETKPTISIGFAIYPDNATTAEGLLSAADHTMFHAKGAGRNNVQFYADLLHSKSQDREHVALQARLNTVIQNGALELFYQPVVDPVLRTVVSVEALVRWHDAAAGYISPEVFVPMAEKLGLIKELGDQVMEMAFATLQRWRAKGYTQNIAINLSRSQLFAHDFVPRMMARLDAYGLNVGDIILEITESVALTDYSHQSKHLRELADLGFKIAIDDFGTGYSSLSQLHEMPVDVIKIDVSFTSRLNTTDGQRIVQAIVQMAQALHIGVVVEGVETLEAVEFLMQIGVDKLQGYYYSRPLTAPACEQLLSNGLAI